MTLAVLVLARIQMYHFDHANPGYLVLVSFPRLQVDSISPVEPSSFGECFTLTHMSGVKGVH